MSRVRRVLAAVMASTLASPAASGRDGATTAARAKPRAYAVDPSAYPLRRAVEALAKPDAPLPGDPCRHSSVPPGVPCFAASVERQGLTPEQKLARFFEGFDARYGPTFASAPTVGELWQLPAIHGIPLDFVPLIKLLLEVRRRRQPPRYFLYSAREGERAWPVLREGRLPAEIAYARPGVSYQELGGFPDRKSAEAAYERLEHALAASAGVKP